MSIAYILHYKRKLHLKVILFAIISLFIFIFILSFLRGDYFFDRDDGLLTFFYVYILSPLTAFDILINNQISLGESSVGESFFIFVYRILNLFGADIQFSQLGEWVNVPLPTNVYTVMRSYYIEGGLWGIGLGSSVLGIIWGILYRLTKRGNPIYIIFYALMLPSLFFQSFGDYFFYNFSVNLQFLLFTIILTRAIKF